MKKAIATLLSMCMMFNIASQAVLARVDDSITPEPLAAGQEAAAAPTAPNPAADSTATPEDAVKPEGEEAPAVESPAEESVTLLEETEPPEEAPEEETPELPTNIAGVELSITASLPIQKDLPFQIQLDGPTGGTRQVTLPAVNGSTLPMTTASFEGLENGTYTLTVRGPGFAAYRQQIQVNDLVYGLQLYTDFQAGFNYTAGSAHPGVLLIGDLDGNDLVNQTDAEQMVDALEAERQDSGYDLNGDGLVDLTDLQMLAGSLGETRENTAALTTRLPAALTQGAVDAGTVVAGGSLEGVLDGSQTVSLQPAGGNTITEATPVVMEFDFGAGQDSTVAMEGVVIQTPAGSVNAVSGATIQVEYEENGETKTMELPVSAVSRAIGAQIQADGSIVVDFGSQIAVKKVTIKVTATTGGTSLAEISKVEFVNDMESRIPAPQMDIPQNLQVQTGSKTFTVTWDPAVNVTGYEVLVSANGRQETLRTAVNSITVNQFGGEKLVNNTVYSVRVQSLNGEWRSGYGDPVTAVPKPDTVPPAPDGLSLTGHYQRIEASWKAMKDTDSYNLYFRKAGEGNFTKVEVGTANKYTIYELENNTRYEVYVTGVNELGEGPASITSVATTADVTPVKLPAYRLINTPGAAGELTAHILNATHSAGYMKDSPLDSGNTAFGVVDNDFASWYGLDDWDDGAAYPDAGGVRITFDGSYTIGSISLTQSEDRGTYGNARVFALNENGKEYQLSGVTIVQRSADNGRKYYTIKIPGGVITSYLRVCVGYTYWNKPVSISEMRFYAYDSLEDDILALYADDLHLTLQPEVDEAAIQALEARLNTPDEVSGELHPEYSALKTELDNARGLLDQGLNDLLQVSTGITAARDGHLGFTGLNAWQPLGVTAHAGEEIVVYVGSNSRKTGDTAPLQLVATQFFAEHNTVASQPIQLKVGRNEITIPELQTLQTEHGGALYVQYTGNNSSEQYSVRVSGGTRIPSLNLYGVEDGETRLSLVRSYLAELETYAAGLEELHNTRHKGSGIAVVDYDYNPEECILNTTDILLDQMMLSLPVTQVLAGLTGAEDPAARLCASMDAMDQMMVLFYQHKGLTDQEGAGDKNRLPSQHLNIRYQRMFAGAFMYAAYNHIGIGWGSVPGLTEGSPVQLNEDGSYRSGNLFGWGIAHEIGHNINQSSYTLVEVTNNYFSQISQASEGVRFSYDEVYRKVTSGTTGHSDNVFTQLALYWQLHLAYDAGYEYQTYDNYEELFRSIFFARVDTYARNTAAAPAPEGVTLTLGKDSDQNLMRLACAAAEKDLTDFFTRWGMVPDATTAAYAAQFEAETRALYYGNDAARDYRFTHDASATIAGQQVVTDATSAAVDARTPNQVHLTLASNLDADLLLGYEITRITYENGIAHSQVVGFTTDSSYTDTITTLNNRAVSYQVAAVDKFLNRSAAFTLPAVKISHDGSYGKELWTVTTNMVSADDTTTPGSEHDPCEPEPVSAISRVADNDNTTTYTGAVSKGNATVTIDFHKSLALTGFKYTVTEGTPIRQYEAQISADGADWQTMAAGTFGEEEVNTVYFRNENNDPWVCTYDAVQFRLIVKDPAGSQVSISEIDLLGPTGDNVELLDDGIGILAQDYRYGTAEEVIPAGSLVFTGSYKGNPAYNVVLLYDENGNLVGGTDAEGNLVAHQIILAEVPEQGELGEVSEGGWVYWIEPDQLEEMTLPAAVRAELYRVDNATTNEGQRLTSDTLTVTLPEELPPITIGGTPSEG